ncbi:MAG: hypothetical protein CEO12_451 [Parcubacteria group bacterium Gr01-1014_46]|nr:MAG: hypothetical protein CEO12_451 [Parcubacteria group bacterium Gr01-1014_46]
MKVENSVLRKQAREALVGKWGVVIGTFVLYLLVSTVAQGFSGSGDRAYVGGIASFIIAGPLSLGLAMFTLSISRNKELKVAQIFDGFKNFSEAFLAHLLRTVFTVLWALLLIVPGIVAAISYSMIFFIIADDPNIGAGEAIKKSKKMMYGHKWKYFKLLLSFLGWALLCILTLGIGFLWLAPYVQVSTAKFYEDVKNLESVSASSAIA